MLKEMKLIYWSVYNFFQEILQELQNFWTAFISSCVWMSLNFWRSHNNYFHEQKFFQKILKDVILETQPSSKTMPCEMSDQKSSDETERKFRKLNF